MLSETTDLRDKLFENTQLLGRGCRMRDSDSGRDSSNRPGVVGHLPNDAKLSQEFANALLDEGVYVIGFYYPIVPKGKSRIRVQKSAAHSLEQIGFALDKFRKVGKKLGAI